MTPWDPEAYLRFEDYRTRPAVDLVARIAIDAPESIVDLGCGPGNSTQILRRRWPHARIEGLDSSPEMIASARRSHPDQSWVLGEIGTWSAVAPCDVVFSNAALQWVRGHAALVPRLLAQVAPGGALAFQIPSGAYSPVRAFIQEIAGEPAWARRMEGARRALTMEPPHVYYDALAPVARSVDVWETEYNHPMDSPSAIVEWISATGLRPFLDALDDDERRRFVAQLTDRVAGAYPARADGRVLFPFRRTFVVARARGTGNPS